IGGEITWKCMGTQDTFLISANIYRDCNGISISNQSINYILCGVGKNAISNTKMSAGVDVTPTSKTACNRSQSSTCVFPYGIQRYTFTATLALKKGIKTTCCDMVLSWELFNSRSYNAKDFYVEANLNRCIKPCDNSPYATNLPILITRKNQSKIFNYGVIDDDGDSLVYYMTDPLQGAGNKLSYNSPYSKKKPLWFAGFPNADSSWLPNFCGFHFDSATGDMQFMPIKTDQTIIVVKIQEWGKDSANQPYKKGDVMIDAQLIIIDTSTNHVPMLSGIDGTSQTEIHMCESHYKCFTINSYDADTTDTVFVDWNKGIPGATFINEKNKKHPKSIFCWQPKPQDVRSTPYTFVVNAMDDDSPINGRVSRAYSIYVHEHPQVNVIDSAKGCGDVVFYAFPKNNTDIAKYVWSIEDYDHSWIRYGNKISHHFRKPGTYKWRVDFENKWKCEGSDSGTYTMPQYLEAELPKDTSVCAYTNLFIPVKAYKGTPPYSYTWSTGGDKKKAYSTPTITRDTTIFVRVNDFTNCSNSDTMHIKVLPTPNMPTITQSNDSLYATKTSGNYQWMEDSTDIAGATHQYYKPTKFGKYKVRVTGGNGCFSLTNSYAYPSGVGIENSTNEFTLNIYPNPAKDILNIEVVNTNLVGFENLRGLEISLFNTLGQKVFEAKSKQTSYQIDLKNIPTGVYRVQVIAGESRAVKQVVKL
ncbi:MAG: T9SS type A sorting domain-containing protein, partial [Bacteroidetes bacterium]|nr:T9SS type A sorting domain-containing protein [Bacteroidota bacterium]